MISVSTASAVVQDGGLDENVITNDSDESDADESNSNLKGNKRTLKLRVYSQKEEPNNGHINEITSNFVEDRK